MNPTNPTPTLRPRSWVATALVAIGMLAVQYLTRVAQAPPPPVKPQIAVTTPAVTKTEPAPKPAPPPAPTDPEIRRLAADYYRLYPAGYQTARSTTTTPYDRVMQGLAELRTAARDELAAAIDAKVKPLVGPDGNYTDRAQAAGVFALVESSLKAGLRDASE